jgi:hypothetical protein
MALRLRRGQPNSNREMYDQIFPTARSWNPLPLPLLVVHLDRAACEEGERWLKNIADSGLNEDEHKALLSRVVLVDASAMSPTAWLKLVKQKEDETEVNLAMLAATYHRRRNSIRHKILAAQHQDATPRV